MDDDDEHEFSLLKYDPPIRILQKSERRPSLTLKQISTDLKKEYVQAKNEAVLKTKAVSPIFEEAPSQLSPEEKKEAEQTREILDSIFPPRRIERGGRSYMIHVSCSLDGKSDLQNLQDRLDAELMKETSEDIGLCPTRRKLFEQCFDELIRQIIITNRDRGWLLRRVKDEFEMTLAAAQSLQESVVAYGIRKAIEGEQYIIDVENQLALISEEKEDLKNQISKTAKRCELAERRVRAQMEQDERNHVEEMQILNKSNEEIKSQLYRILSLDHNISAKEDLGEIEDLDAGEDVDANKDDTNKDLDVNKDLNTDKSLDANKDDTNKDLDVNKDLNTDKSLDANKDDTNKDLDVNKDLNTDKSLDANKDDTNKDLDVNKDLNTDKSLDANKDDTNKDLDVNKDLNTGKSLDANKVLDVTKEFGVNENLNLKESPDEKEKLDKNQNFDFH